MLSLSLRRLLFILLVSIGLLNSLAVIVYYGNNTFFPVDEPSYKKGMFLIAESNDFLNLKDIYHSPGYQIYLAVLYKIFPIKDKIIFITKIILWLLNLGCIFIIFYLGEKYFGQYVGMISAILFSFSYKYYIYMNLLQYEVLAGFLFLLYIYIHTGGICHKTKYIHYATLFFLGLLVSAVCFIQVGYIPLFLFSCLAIYIKLTYHAKKNDINGKGILLSFFLFLLPIILTIGLWSAYYSLINHRLIIISDSLSKSIVRGNNLNSGGFDFPYPEVTGPTGVKFIISYPGKFLQLIKERFLFFWGLKKDVGYIEHPLIKYINLCFGKNVSGLFFHVAYFLIFFMGMVTKLTIDIKNHLVGNTACFYLIFLSILTGPLLYAGSHRFSVPTEPIVAIFQGYFLVLLFNLAKRRMPASLNLRT